MPRFAKQSCTCEQPVLHPCVVLLQGVGSFAAQQLPSFDPVLVHTTI